MTRSAALGACLIVAGGPLTAQWLTYDGSLSASSGTYFFTERTTSFVLNNGATVRAGRFRLWASIPLWYQNTTLVTSTGAGAVPGGGPYGREAVQDSGEARQQRKGQGGGNGPNRSPVPASASATTASAQPDVPAPPQSVTGYTLALGDPMMQGTVDLAKGSRISLSVSASAKIPLADTTSIGTGEWDLGTSASASFILSSRLTAGIDAYYWHLGDLPDFDFQDPLTGSLSLGTVWGEGWGALASFAAGTSALTGYDPPVWLSAAVSRASGGGSVGVHLSVGLSETVADLSFGLIWSIRLREQRR